MRCRTRSVRYLANCNFSLVTPPRGGYTSSPAHAGASPQGEASCVLNHIADGAFVRQGRAKARVMGCHISHYVRAADVRLVGTANHFAFGKNDARLLLRYARSDISPCSPTAPFRLTAKIGGCLPRRLRLRDFSEPHHPPQKRSTPDIVGGASFLRWVVRMEALNIRRFLP